MNEVSRRESSQRIAARIMQDLAGVQTWVNKTRQDQIQNDSNKKEEPSSSEDGKPRRDRVLPLPSGHPKGRDEQRAGPPVFNTPPDSTGSPRNRGVKVSPNAIPNQPEGKPLHQRPRSSAMPGDEYGHPYLDGKSTTGIARRPMVASDEDSERLGVARADISLRVPVRRQREQKGRMKWETSRDYKRNKRKNSLSKRNERARWYRRNKTRVKRRMKLYRSRKHRHERLRGGGISTQDQKNRRDQKRRKSAMHREAVRSVMSKMYRQIRTDFVRPLEIQGDSSPLLLPRPLPCFVRGRGLFLDGVSSCLENTLLREPQTNRRIYFPTEDFSSSVRWVDGFDSEAFDLFLEKQEEWSDS